MKPTIVILDGQTVNPGDNPWSPIEAFGDVRLHDFTPPDQVVARVDDANIVLTNKVALNADMLAKLPKLKLICVTATGFNNVDVAAARKLQIVVCNVPAYSTDAVAQLVFALLLELCHHVGLHDSAVKAGEWSSTPHFAFWKTPLIELSGKTMGIFGFGSIGKRVGEIAHAFNMPVIAYNPSKKPKPGYEPFEFVAIDELFSRSDVISLHSPLTDETRSLINESRLKLMKRSAFLINTARGALIDEVALAAALSTGVIAGAAVDVVSVEPMLESNPLRTAKNIIITPHIAWAPLTARQRVMNITAENISAFLQQRPVNVVN